MCSRFYLYIKCEADTSIQGTILPEALGQRTMNPPSRRDIRESGDGEELLESAMNLPSRRDIRPGDRVDAAVYEPGAVKLSKRSMRWGFPLEKGMVINARAESVAEKTTFRDSFALRRCVLPADGFYEWNAAREKADFSMDGDIRFYLAGIYSLFDGEERFLVLTTEANATMRSIHDRMPLILDKKEAARWVLSKEAALGLLAKTPPALRKKMEYEQQNLQFILPDIP